MTGLNRVSFERTGHWSLTGGLRRVQTGGNSLPCCWKFWAGGNNVNPVSKGQLFFQKLTNKSMPW